MYKERLINVQSAFLPRRHFLVRREGWVEGPTRNTNAVAATQRQVPTPHRGEKAGR